PARHRTCSGVRQCWGCCPCERSDTPCSRPALPASRCTVFACIESRSSIGLDRLTGIVAVEYIGTVAFQLTTLATVAGVAEEDTVAIEDRTRILAGPARALLESGH